MVPGTLDAGGVDGKLYGLMASMNVKSLIFYPKKAFEAKGYQVPKTLDELTALADQIRTDGGTPWCMTMESGGATGWVATDWFEDLIMRIGSPEEYQQWVDHEIPFDSDLVREAAAYFEDVAFTEGNVAGGRESITATPVDRAARPMFEKAGPQCWLLKQGSFVNGPDFLPADIYENADEELGVAGFPPAEAGGDEPGHGWRRPGGAAERRRGRQGGDAAAVGDRHRRRGGDELDVHLPAQGLRRLAVRERDRAEHRAVWATTRRSSCSTGPTRCRPRWARAASGRRSPPGSSVRSRSTMP